jgi:LPXTG-site transpeptidase (sortase) family protein
MKLTVSTQKTGKPWLWRNRTLVTATATTAAFLLYLAAYGFGLVPSTLQYQNNALATTSTTTESSQTVSNLETEPEIPTNELPQSVQIPAINIETRVQNPTSKTVGVLNRYLSQSAVRYPGSGHPGNGNMFIFGHSSGLDSVLNQAYKTFNRLEDLQEGEKIYITTDTGTFEYAVSTVEKKKDSAAYVPFDTEKDLLTIATCDNFGTKEDRIIVRAEFIEYERS